jgi:AcrR family transcriptional regulator
MNQTVHSRRRVAGARSPGRETSRTNDPERTMANIMEVALAEFAEKGLAGARIDEIAAATQTSKRMIYYYFESKEGLYLAVLEASYAAMRKTESELQLDNLEPVAALRRLVEFTFDHHFHSEPYIRLVMAENMLRGQFLAQSQNIQQLNTPAISAIEKVYARGVASGQFRAGLDPIDLHATISALSFFNVANRHTFGMIFKRDYADPTVAAQRRATVVETVLRYASREPRETTDH